MNTEALLVASKETGLEMYGEKTMRACLFIPRGQNAGQYFNMKVNS